jgi:hypothetical protein
MKFADILEGIESSFLSDENATLELIDFEYRINAEDISRFLTRFSNRSLIFRNTGEEKNRFIFFMGKRNGSELSKIIFHEEFFSLNLNNLQQLVIQNIQFIFLSQKMTWLGCLICLEETENTVSFTILKLYFVNFESISGLAISPGKRDFSLIDFVGYNFTIDLESINIHIQTIGYFQNFLKIYGIVLKQLDYGFYTRFIGVRNLSFMGGESLTILRNTLENLNVSFEASLFNVVNFFEINILSTAIKFLDCSFLLGKEQSSLRNAANSFISINNTNITIDNSSFRGDYSIINENYIFFISERSRVLIFNLIIEEINIAEVSYR